MTYRVFVSHSGRDRPWMEWVKGQTGPGVELWLAEHDPAPGQHLPTKVQQAIERCHAVMVFITEAARVSPFVQQEIGWALRAKTPIIPVVQEGIRGNVLAMLQGVEYIAFDFDNPEAGKDVLLNHLRALAQAKKASDDLQTALMLVGALVLVGALAYGSGSGSGVA